MRNVFVFLSLLSLPFAARADNLPLVDALRATYTACIGIDDELHDLKQMAGINTAVTAVGTATAGGATVVGLVKAAKDKEAEELEEIIREIEDLLDEQNMNPADPTDEDIAQFNKEFESSYASVVQELDAKKQQLDKLTKQSKRLGNWRTGLIATSTATNIAGAIIAGTGQSARDLQSMIDECKGATDILRISIGQAQINGEDVSEAREILSACEEYNYVDISKIANRGKGVFISSIVDATTGAAGTVTSAMANTNKVRNDNTDSGRTKEKNLNTAANVLSGATAAASATATVFNATQISAIKRVASVAEKCTGALR